MDYGSNQTSSGTTHGPTPPSHNSNISWPASNSDKSRWEQHGTTNPTYPTDEHCSQFPLNHQRVWFTNDRSKHAAQTMAQGPPFPPRGPMPSFSPDVYRPPLPGNHVHGLPPPRGPRIRHPRHDQAQSYPSGSQRQNFLAAGQRPPFARHIDRPPPPMNIPGPNFQRPPPPVRVDKPPMGDWTPSHSNPQRLHQTSDEQLKPNFPPSLENTRDMKPFFPPTQSLQPPYTSDMHLDQRPRSDKFGVSQDDHPPIAPQYASTMSASHCDSSHIPHEAPPKDSEVEHSARLGLTLDKGDEENNDLVKAEKKRQMDENWVKSFISRRCHNKRKTPCTSRKLTIRNAQHLIKEALMLKTELTNLMTHTQTEPDLVDEMQISFRGIKQRLEEIKAALADEDDLKQLQTKLVGIRKKRTRQRRHRESLQQEKLEAEKQRNLSEAKIDQWQASLKQKELDIKKAKELKKSADSILGEVRQKETEGKRCQDLLEALVRLRQLQKDKAERRGSFFVKDVDNIFNERLHALEELWQKQRQVYQEEQRVLEVMMEVEHEETKEKEMEKVRKKDEKTLRIYKRNLGQYLFGPEEELSPGDPLYPHRLYYESAKHSADNLIRIRQEWDMYLSIGSSVDGSSVPVDWVIPSSPSGPVWASASKTR